MIAGVSPVYSFVVYGASTQSQVSMGLCSSFIVITVIALKVINLQHRDSPNTT